MKKTKLLFTTLALASSLLLGCKNTNAKEQDYFFGFGSVATYKVTAAKAEQTGTLKNGRVQTTITYLAVVTDTEGKIANTRLDVVQITVNPVKKAEGDVKAETALASKVNAEGDPKSKWELLGDYGMKGASPIQKEWYEQAEAFENWTVGKTLAEVKAGVSTDGLHLTDEAVGVTITVNDFVAALEEALDNKVAFKGTDVAADLHVGVGGFGSRSADTLQDTFVVTGVALSKDKVNKAALDEYQIPYDVVAAPVLLDGAPAEALNVVVAAKKQVVPNDALTGTIKSKHDLGDLYGMKGASPIQKEWYEQANALVAALEGKTMDDAFKTLNEGDNMANAGVTIHTNTYEAAFKEADKTARNKRY
jgi:hypothetical protein